MKRKLASVVAAAIFSGVCLVGCADESKVSTTETVKTPEGSTTTTDTKKVESSGSNPPANSAGETAKTPK